ncbi:MAG: sigma-70 family RNA polymerase sigma factor [Actinobacteria bacterium]|nr:sigma-70 family RNA polymerase sigma factor [Actinomycetota bacterium]
MIHRTGYRDGGSRLTKVYGVSDVAEVEADDTGVGTVDLGQSAVDLEVYRGELTGYCYRMLGSPFEAEDAVQETLLRAWRAADRFQGRSSLRTWLYRIATNVCIDALRSRPRRARPMDLGPASPASAALPAPLPETVWLEPVPDARIITSSGDPADVAAQRDSVRLAFVAALQHLPARQRAVLILREVLRWPAAEVAGLLESTVASVNSALQRARATLAGLDLADTDTFRPLDEEQQALLARYVDAFERYDLDALTALLHEEVVQSMPPYGLWLRGHADIRGWYLGAGIGCRGSRLVPTVANGAPAFGQYRPAPAGGHEPWSLQIVEISDGMIVGLNAFLDTARLFPLFGLPPRLDA